MSEKNLIFGITGQDGSILTELLLEKGHEVHGVIRRSSSFNTGKIDHLMANKEIYNKKLFLHYGDITDSLSTNNIISSIKPKFIYNLAAQSHVKTSFEIPLYTANVDGLGQLHILESAKNHVPDAKIYNAATSELYGGVPELMPFDGYNESTPFYPRSPYGVAKQYAFWITKNYREAYNLHASNGILFNHESSRRTPTFVTRKITKWIGENIKKITTNEEIFPLELGNLDAIRDWGHAKDYMKAAILILNQKTPGDYVVATGETHTVREFLEKCLKYFNLDIKWKGSGIDEIGMVNDKIIVKINPRYFRPTEVHVLKGNASKIKNLGWKPECSFNDLIKEMIENDLK